jgi:hypothetical protein
LFLFRATRGKDRTGSSSVESQSATADGRHLASYPIRTSKRYEQTAVSAMKSQPGTCGRVDKSADVRWVDRDL